MASKKIGVRVQEIQNGIHHVLIGEGVLQTGELLTANVDQYCSLKLYGPMPNAYIDFKIHVKLPPQPKLPVQGL